MKNRARTGDFSAVGRELARATACVLTLMLLSTALPAQEKDPSNIEVSSGSEGVSPHAKKRALSQDISKSLSFGIKYQPPPPPKPEEEEVDLRDSDKPKNEIIRLPKYVVEGTRPPVFIERNLYSNAMLKRLAYQRYLSPFSRNVLNTFRLPIIGGGVEDYALMQYEADERKRAMAQLDDRLAMYRTTGDDTAADNLTDEIQNPLRRRSESSPATNATK